MSSGNHQILIGHALQVLDSLERDSVHCVIASPPYWSGTIRYTDKSFNWPRITFATMASNITLNDRASVLGCETTQEEYLGNLLCVFRKVKDVLTRDGTLFLVIGDSVHRKCHSYIPEQLMLTMRHEQWNIDDSLIWLKGDVVGQSAADRILVLSKGNSLYSTQKSLYKIWQVPQDPVSENSFFRLPVVLARRMIQSGTAPKGCCKQCRVQLGRKSRCQYHKNTEAIPSTVLDLFGGSGVVTSEALCMGRSAIYIDIDEPMANALKENLKKKVYT